MRNELLPAVCIVLFGLAGPAYAAHPLITDDAGTQGKGKFQLEFVGKYGQDKENGMTTNSFEVPTPPVLSYGIADTVDLVLSTSYQDTETKQFGVTTAERGASDTSLQVKWRFHEKDVLRFAVKQGLSLPTGDDQAGDGYLISRRNYLETVGGG